MLKILLVGNYPPPFGGISVHLQLLHCLLRREGIDCLVLNIDPQAFPSRNYIKISNYANFLIRLITASHGRVVHLHTNGHNSKSWWLAAVTGWLSNLFGRGAIVTIHSGLAPDYIKNACYWRQLLIKLALIPQSFIICVNSNISAELNTSSYCREKTRLMPAFLFDRRERIGLDDELAGLLTQFDPLLSIVAFFRPEYGVELLIEALAILKKDFPRIGCVIMGSGNGKAKLRQLAIDCGVANNLLWLGDLDHSKCLGVMKSSRLFVRPTLADGDSISVREALQLGVSVVASDVGYRPPSVILFRSGDAVDLATKCGNALLVDQTAHQINSSTSDLLSLMIDTYNSISQSQAVGSELWRG
ncbi:MAG: glycosyltransferase [Acidobacteriota bacterium]